MVLTDASIPVAGAAHPAQSQGALTHAPLIQFNGCSPKTQHAGDSLMTALRGEALQTPYGAHAAVPQKGAIEDAAKHVNKWLLEAGHENQKIESQSDGDGEPAIAGLTQAIDRKHAETLFRTNPPGHHQSQGGVECWAQAIQSKARTSRLAPEETVNSPALASSCCGAPCFQHGPWVHNRSHVRPDGRTPRQAAHGRQCATEVRKFGTLASAKTGKSSENGRK